MAQLRSVGAEDVISGDKQKRALGRGLSALIPQAGAVPVSGDLPAKGGVVRIAIEDVHRDLRQPRKMFDESKLKELADSIRVQGVIQPILVRREDGKFRLIAGERRWRAAQLAGLREIPAVVRDASDAEAFELALVENLQRTDLNPIEEAEGYRRLVDEFRLTQEQVSQRVGKDRSSVANALRLLALPDEVKVMLAEGSLSMGHARALLSFEDTARIQALAKRVASERLSVRETERLVKQQKSGTAPAAEPTPRESPQVRAVTEELQRLLGTKVRLHDRGEGKGFLEIDFYSYDDLDRILNLLRK